MLLVNVLLVPDAPAVVALVKLPDTTIPAFDEAVDDKVDVKSILQLLTVLKSALLIK